MTSQPKKYFYSMKKINIASLLLVVFLSACGGSESKVDSALTEQILYF